MKEITMREYFPNASGNGWKLAEFVKYRRVSRWIRIQEKHVTHRHPLYCYTDEDGYLMYFRHAGHEYAIDQFLALMGAYMFEQIVYTDEAGKNCHLSGYYGDDYFSKLYCELDEYGEYIRLYERIDK